MYFTESPKIKALKCLQPSKALSTIYFTELGIFSIPIKFSHAKNAAGSIHVTVFGMVISPYFAVGQAIKVSMV